MEFTIPRIPLDDEGLCAHATIVSANTAFGLPPIKQDLLHKFVNDPTWGTENEELRKMANSILPKDHVIVKENADIDDLDTIFKKNRAVIVLDITDRMNRVSNITRQPVHDVDGHYVIFAGIYDGMALIVDPSAEEIVTNIGKSSEKLGIQLTDVDNVYKLPVNSLKEIWTDTNKDGSQNLHWAMIMLHPEDKVDF